LRKKKQAYKNTMNALIDHIIKNTLLEPDNGDTKENTAEQDSTPAPQQKTPVKQEVLKFFSEVLLIAIRSGDSEMTKKLLEQGANPNITTGQGATPLIAAAEAGNLEIVQTLLSKGAEVEATKKDLFIAAAQSNNLRLVQTLLNKGAEVETLTALHNEHKAQQGKNFNIAPLIMDHVKCLLLANSRIVESINNFQLLEFCKTALNTENQQATHAATSAAPAAAAAAIETTTGRNEKAGRHS
jgi:hypothetical protein